MNENMKWALDEIHSQDSNRIPEALLSLTFYDDNWEFVEDLCIQYSENMDYKIREIAITCLGYLAKIHGQLHFEKVIPVINRAMEDRHEHIRRNAYEIKNYVESSIYAYSID